MKLGTGMSAGRHKLRPNALANSPFVIVPGATPLSTPVTLSSSMANKNMRAMSDMWIHGRYWRPLLTGPPRPR